MGSDVTPGRVSTIPPIDPDSVPSYWYEQRNDLHAHSRPKP